MFAYMLTGERMPFIDSPDPAANAYIKDNVVAWVAVHEGLTAEEKGWLQGMLHPVPDQRCSPTQALRHDYIQRNMRESLQFIRAERAAGRGP